MIQIEVRNQMRQQGPDQMGPLEWSRNSPRPNKHIWWAAQGRSLTSPNCEKIKFKKYFLFGGVSLVKWSQTAPLAIWITSHGSSWPLPRRNNREAECVHAPDHSFWKCSFLGHSRKGSSVAIWPQTKSSTNKVATLLKFLIIRYVEAQLSTHVYP